MGRARSFVIAGVSAVALLLVSSAGAVAPNTHQGHRIDLSSTSKIHAYLRSIGLNPRTVVIQRGKKNYAGPNCPGHGWNCTKGTRVLQVGSQNTFECIGGTGTGETGGTQTCTGTGVQSGNKNTFRCIERTSANVAVQSCKVTQSGSSNYARIEQVADQSTTTLGAQEATQTAEVQQTGAQNELHVFQRIKQTMTTPDQQTQDAHQALAPPDGFSLQSSVGPGNNYAQIHQYIDQRASGAATIQRQNTPDSPTDIVEVADCHPAGSPGLPNQCVDGEQSTGMGGQNHLHLRQLIDQDARSSLDATQTQGDALGGIDARVHQVVGGVVGTSRSQAHQAMRQNVAGAEGSVQIQIDPTRCCGVSQHGGTNNSQDINQSSAQNSDENASQSATLIGVCDTLEGACAIHHHGRNDVDNETFSQRCDTSTEETCTYTQTTQCNSFAGEGGSCFIDDETCEECTALTGPSLFTASNLLPGTPLSGFEVTMGLVEPNLSVLP